jgi:branched-chain amino acid transport system substrate-binding protein
MKVARVGAVIAVAAIVVSACSGSATPSPSAAAASAAASAAAPSAAASASAAAPASAAAGSMAVKIGIELPMTGGEAPNGVPTANGVALAIAKNPVPGFTVTINQQDDAVNGVHNPQQGAKNISTLANDPTVIGIVGPYNSSVAQAEIPVSNAAGLMMCSPANTNPGLTKPWGGADPLSLRPTNPTKIAYVRVATTDDLQGAAGADIAFNIAKATTAYVADDTQTYGKGLSDVFATQFAALGGKVLKRDGIPGTTTDFTSYVTTVKGLAPQYVFYGGVTTSGIGLFRLQMGQQGIANIPLGGGDGISDGSAATKSSFLQIAGAAGDPNTYSTVAGPTQIPNAAQFAADYKAMFNTDPGAYSAAGYACAQVYLQALAKVGAGITDPAALREAVRAYVATPSNTYDTALGTFSFDASGDTSQKIISYFQYDAASKNWKFLKQRDFTAEPLK